MDFMAYLWTVYGLISHPTWVTTLQASGRVLLLLDFLGAGLAIIVLLPPLKYFCRLPPMSLLAILVCGLLRIPTRRKLLAFAQAILTRANNNNDAVAYMDRIIDRQINKGRGILPFNSILMTINSFELSSAKRVTDPLISSLIDDVENMIFATLALSSLLLLELFWVHWSPLNDYRTAVDEVLSTARMARDRSIILDSAIMLSIAGVIGVSFTTFAAHAYLGPPKP